MRCRGPLVRAGDASRPIWNCSLPSHERLDHALTRTPKALEGEQSQCSWRGSKSCCHRHPRWRSCVEEALADRDAAFVQTALGQRFVEEATAQPVGDDAASFVQKSGLPHGRASTLTFVQGYRHASEYAIQAHVLTMHAGLSLVSESDLLLHCNNPAVPPARLLASLSLYPHRTRVLLRTADNAEGYSCGLLHAVAGSRAIWAPYKLVLVMHPDIYLLPKAMRWLESAIRSAPHAAFLVTNLSPRFAINGTTGRRILPVVKEKVYNTDLFLFRPPLAASLAWSNACHVPPAEAVTWSERSFWRLIHGHVPAGGTAPRGTIDGHAVHRMGVRATSTEVADNHGVWHSHDVTRAAAFLEDWANRTAHAARPSSSPRA